MASLTASFEKYQFTGAAAAYKQQRYEEALGVLWELFDHDANYKNVAIAIDRVADKLIQRRFDAEDFAAARAILEQVVGRLKDRPHPLTTPWTEKLQTAATAKLTEAKADYDARKYPQANRACRQALAAWPEVPEAQGLAAAIRVKYPEVIVGVTSLSAGASPGVADAKIAAAEDWSARRDARLLTRSILELTRIGPDGNVYTSPLAGINHDKDSRHVTITVKPGLHWPDGVRPLTGADLARSVLAAADPRHPAFQPAWQAIEAGVSVSDVYHLDLELHNPVARIERWLNVGVWSQYEPTGERAGQHAAEGCGPYRLESTTDSEVRFVALPGYFATAASQPREIAERRYGDVAAALQALRAGEVMVVDRVGPWDAAGLAGAKELEIEPAVGESNVPQSAGSCLGCAGDPPRRSVARQTASSSSIDRLVRRSSGRIDGRQCDARGRTTFRSGGVEGSRAGGAEPGDGGSTVHRS
jgi:tetratricopeptide (TPR) repeat protein